MTATADTRVLVTGASGYIGLHCVRALLAAGYSVRGTLRSPAREPGLREALGRHVDASGRLEFVRTDLDSDDGWADAVRDCRYVLHVASPLPSAPPKDENELIVPARDGALRVLRAAKDAGVERVVMTSSLAAVCYGHARDGSRSYDESDWTITEGINAYEKSKTIAERAAWDFVAEHGAPELVTINPGLVMGPLLEKDASTSVEVVGKLLRREFPGTPRLGWAVVDVRDVADAHVAAMTTPEAAGQRFCCAIEHAWMSEIAAILDAHFASRGYRVPRRALPDFVMRAVAPFDKTARLAVADLGLRQDIDSSRIRKVLGFEPRGLEEMVVATGESMIEFGVV